jgi:hypothetical protein
MLRTVPADLEIAHCTTVDPAVLVTTQVTFCIPIHTPIIPLEVVLMRARAVSLPETAAVTIAIVYCMVLARLLNVCLRCWDSRSRSGGSLSMRSKETRTGCCGWSSWN